MKDLNEEYLLKLEAIAQEIQEAPALAQFLEEEEEEYYKTLQQEFEPRISEVYDEVSVADPLQIISLEKVILHSAFEGLYLPRILGYAVLRGEINNQYRYVRPQEHFKEILINICNSPHFEVLRKRVGQSVQIGFALSSDIWVTNMINQMTNKRIRQFLQQQKLDKYRTLESRQHGYEIYSRQFKNDNFYATDFPQKVAQLKSNFSELKQFLLRRIKSGHDNSSILDSVKDLVYNPTFKGTTERRYFICLFANFFELNKEDTEQLKELFNDLRKNIPEFEVEYFDFLLSMFAEGAPINAKTDARASNILDKSYKDDLVDYYHVMDIIHTKGYVHPDAIDAVKVYYSQHEGMSDNNECLRRTIFSYIKQLVSNLSVSEYHDFFELSKTIAIYIQGFNNEQFNKDIKYVSMQYVNKLLKHYTDKRGRDYQDIKKFVSTVFSDLGFLKEKEIVEMFKTRRKKVAASL
ncbi:MAG: hypothetical protein KA974_05510 [Saprospiraceae bacterium]|nr:hypothetical protein [Saprospiraceae bacterium]MBP7679819.1 hypothetical protein [Saprospiraceae bacterium]